MENIVNLNNIKKETVLSRCIDGGTHLFRPKGNGKYYCQMCLLLAVLEEPNNGENDTNIYRLIKASYTKGR